MMDRKSRIAIIGAGGWGYEHARVLKARKDVELCGIVGRTAEKTAARATEFGTRSYTSIEQMLIREKPDLVTTSLPNQQHFEVTRQLIAAGLPLVQRPVALAQQQRHLGDPARRHRPGRQQVARQFRELRRGPVDPRRGQRNAHL